MIVFENVDFAYDPRSPFRKDIFQGLSLSFDQGDFHFIIGKNGTGKSTLLQLCDALLFPQSGIITVEGLKTNDRKALPKIRQRVGLLFQYPEAFFFGPTVRDELCFPLKNWKTPVEKWEGRILRSLEMTGLPREILDRSPFLLSGGEMRLVAIAAMLVTEPTYVLLDEPTVGLDHAGRKRVREMIRAMLDAGNTVILVAHELQLAFDIAYPEPTFHLLEKERSPKRCRLPQLLEIEDLEERYGIGFPSLVEYERIKKGWKRSPVS